MKYVNKAVWKVKIKILYAAKKFQLDSLLDLIVLILNAAVEPVDVAHIFIAGLGLQNPKCWRTPGSKRR